MDDVEGGEEGRDGEVTFLPASQPASELTSLKGKKRRFTNPHLLVRRSTGTCYGSQLLEEILELSQCVFMCVCVCLHAHEQVSEE